ncbi:iron-sulfur cluster scaffold protein nfu-related [Anaeramoeba ignava]|uniref:Iron-sulfur cluster scaffold protein nfu-related n=1 Tax=Anaeramoeba ignava TaxID=1746090 RepID=A0A9Q0LC95_ANAIG|nr:iron-sulfur cluster scaffold protein nfu-related [Anaeramoeba ignava]
MNLFQTQKNMLFKFGSIPPLIKIQIGQFFSNSNVSEEIRNVLNTKIQPALHCDGGGIELVSYDEKVCVAKVRLTGNCSFCPMGLITIKKSVQTIVKHFVPEVQSVDEYCCD